MNFHSDDRTVELVNEAIARPPMVWSPYDGHEARCYTPLPMPGDPERLFGIVRKIADYRFQQLTGHEDVIKNRTRLVDAISGMIWDFRLSCYWQPHLEPDARFCLLCGQRNPNHPDFDRFHDPHQCQTIRDHTVDSPLRLSVNPMYRTLEAATTADLRAMLSSQNLEWK